ncbi:hypothetical protein DPEC_G00181740 [Dallia pectoralis]|uniref:Uncharacterized protein n=1 Tax=Dallia pectoralis TaxID=75939 RepID=A0ACC2GA32_DALPE|nr:hypothetical protein DPEC_G00181740 [Dallia pectoralis]
MTDVKVIAVIFRSVPVPTCAANEHTRVVETPVDVRIKQSEEQWELRTPHTHVSHATGNSEHRYEAADRQFAALPPDVDVGRTAASATSSSPGHADEKAGFSDSTGCAFESSGTQAYCFLVLLAN